jgi:hypothetical protein
MMSRETGRRMPDRLIGAAVLDAGIFVVALVLRWDAGEMVTGIIFLLLVAAVSFRATVHSVWRYR